MQQDVIDWKNLDASKKNFLTQILRLFTQSDIDVAGGYVNNYLPIFPQPEVRMMLLGFAAREAIHIAAYSHLLETLGFPDSVYTEFMEYKEMADKHKFFEEITGKDENNVIQQMCAISAFTEGMQLFSSFVMLLNFGRNNLMPGMTNIVTWSIIDETCLVENTEVLTEFGWKKIQDITLDDIICQYDMCNKEYTFVKPTNLIHSVKETSFIFEAENFHQHVTAEHRMIIDGGEVTAENASGDELFVVSGVKNDGESSLTEEDKKIIKLIVDGDIDVQWIYDKIPLVSSTWAEEAVKYYLSIN